MPNLYIARRAKRRGLLLPMQMNKANPSLLFPLDGVDRSELDDLIRAQLTKLGVTKESDVQVIIEKAEVDSEARIKLEETRKELHRLMALRAEGKKLMQVGYRKWQPAFFRQIKRG